MLAHHGGCTQAREAIVGIVDHLSFTSEPVPLVVVASPVCGAGLLHLGCGFVVSNWCAHGDQSYQPGATVGAVGMAPSYLRTQA